MIIPELILLVYAYNADDPRHHCAKAWWERCIQGRQPVAIPWVVALLPTSCMADWSDHRWASCSLALENQAMEPSNDSDFSRFPGLRWTNPLNHAPIP